MPAVRIQRRLRHRLLPVVNGVVGPHRPREPSLVGAADGADHGHAGVLGQLDQGAADTACRADDERAAREARPRGLVQQGVGHLIVGERRGLLEIDALRQGVHGIGRHRDVLGVAAAALSEIAGAQQHLLPDGEPGDTRADRGDAPGEIVAGIGRQRRHPLVDALADQHVRLPHAEHLGLDQHLVVARLRDGSLAHLHHLGSAGCAL